METHPPRSSPPNLPRLNQHDTPPRLTEEPRRKRPRYSGANDHDVRLGRQVGRRTVALEPGLAVPVGGGRVGGGEVGLSF